MKARFCTTLTSQEYITPLNEYAPKTWLALEIFAVIFVLTKSRSSLPVVKNLPNSTALHAH